jgi:ABC-type glycerol-3-phosphate transport system substrate-binding protein
MKWLRGLVLLAVLTLAVAACGGGSSKSTQGGQQNLTFPTEPVQLEMWWWGEQEAAGAKNWVADTIRLYKQKHPNVTIKPVLQTTDGLVPSFKAAAAAKRGPDIQYFWGGIWSLEPAWADQIVPVSDYIPASELKHYLNAGEDTFDGKVWTAPWYTQPSFPVLYRKDVLAKAGVQPPATWTDLLAACDKLNAGGVTPVAGGIKDGWFGGWLYSLLGSQEVQSVQPVLQAVAGQKSFTDPELANWWIKLQEMRDHRCWNKDINSLELYQGQQYWSDGKAAMTMVAGSDMKKFVEQVGVDKVGVMTMPKWGAGPLAGKLGSTSQTLGITSWSKYPQVAADFIKFMHTPERTAAWFKTTGAFPADDRFDKQAITLPQQRQVFDLLLDGAPYLENYIPTELDSQANFAHSQLVLAGSEDAQKAAEATQNVANRIRITKRSIVKNFGAWAEQQS